MFTHSMRFVHFAAFFLRGVAAVRRAGVSRTSMNYVDLTKQFMPEGAPEPFNPGYGKKVIEVGGRQYRCCCGYDGKAERSGGGLGDIVCYLAGKISGFGCGGLLGLSGYHSWNNLPAMYVEGEAYGNHVDRCMVKDTDPLLRLFGITPAERPQEREESPASVGGNKSAVRTSWESEPSAMTGWLVEFKDMKVKTLIGCKGIIGNWERREGEEPAYFVRISLGQSQFKDFRLKESTLEKQSKQAMLGVFVPVCDSYVQSIKDKQQEQEALAKSAGTYHFHGDACPPGIAFSFTQGDPAMSFWDFEDSYWLLARDHEHSHILHRQGGRWVVSKLAMGTIQARGRAEALLRLGKEGDINPLTVWQTSKGKTGDQWQTVATQILHCDSRTVTAGQAYVTENDVLRHLVMQDMMVKDQIRRARRFKIPKEEHYDVLDSYRALYPLESRPPLPDSRDDGAVERFTAAHRALILKFHPDRAGKDPDVQATYTRIHKAAEFFDLPSIRK